MQIRFLIIFLLVGNNLFAAINTDSLERVLESEIPYDDKKDALKTLISYYKSNDPRKGLKLANDFLSDSNLSKEPWRIIASVLNDKGLLYTYITEYDSAIIHFNKSVGIYESHNDTSGIGNVISNLGMVYKNKGDYQKAVEYHLQALKIVEELDDKEAIASTYNNIGVAYEEMQENEMALKYYRKSLEVCKELDMPIGIGILSNNIGVIYEQEKDYEKALLYFKDANKIFTDLNHQFGIANTLRGIGVCYHKLGNFEKAEEKLTESLNIRKKIEDKHGIAQTSKSLGSLYTELGKVDKAIPFLKEALQISNEVELALIKLESLDALKTAYQKAGVLDSSLSYANQYIAFRDSIYKLDKNKQIQEINTKYETDKKEQEIKLLKRDQELADLEKDKNRVITIAVSVGLGVVCVFLIVIFNRLRVTRKQKLVIEQQKIAVDEANEELNQTNEELAAQRDEIEIQKEKIEEAHQEIKDSINYAKRIQNAILPPQTLIDELLPNSFILYKPKDVVAGDFYWLEKSANNILFAAADCTGHGVPGAMVSVVCHNAMNRAVREFGFVDPGKILDKTREIVLEELSKSGDDVKDGMDIALCSINGNKLKYAGANNPIWIIRNDNILETKANKQPIGKFDQPVPFTTHNFQLETNDIIYIFSDGFADQFGGPNNKKFGMRNLRNLLLKIHKEDLKSQSVLLDNAFEEWRDESNEDQLDDVCLMAVKI